MRAVIHYHGTPITPRAALATMAGRHFCVSHAAPGDLAWCLRHGASVMLDNGAFSAWTQGRAPDWPAFYAWAEPHLRHPHWAVVPDVVDGDEAANDALLAACPLPRAFAAPVWHMHESLDRLARLADGWPRICFGSSGHYRDPGTAAWVARIDAAWNMLARTGRHPWTHMLRAMREASHGPWPFRQRRQHEHRTQSRRRRRTACADTGAHGATHRRAEPAPSRQARNARSLVVKRIVLAGAFLACIPAANWLIGNVGTVCVPNGPCLIPVAPGLMAPSGVLLIGAALALRDAVHEALGRAWVLALVLAGAALSLAVSPPALAVASAVAFLLSELLDYAVYDRLRARGLPLAVMLSGAAGAGADSLLFSWLAFGTPKWATGLILAKLYASAAYALWLTAKQNTVWKARG